MAEVFFSQSGAELRIQDGSAYERKGGHVRKQPTSLNRESGIGLTDFHGDTNQARVTKNVTQLGYLQCPVVLNDRSPSGKRS